MAEHSKPPLGVRVGLRCLSVHAVSERRHLGSGHVVRRVAAPGWPSQTCIVSSTKGAVVSQLHEAVSNAWEFRAANEPRRAVDLATDWLAQPLPDSGTQLAELGELFRCATLCAEAGERSEWSSRALAAFAISNCGNGMASMLIPEAFALLKDPAAGPASALDWVSRMEPLIGTGVTATGPNTEMVWRLFHEKRGFLQHLCGLLDDALESYGSAGDKVDRNGRPRDFLKVELGRLRVEWDKGVDRDQLVGDQERLVAEVRSLGAKAADLLGPAERNLEAIHRGERPAEPYEIVE